VKRCILIPVHNEEESLPLVLNDIPKDFIESIVVVNNGSTDNSAKVAKEHGALVVEEPTLGYGQACLAGISYINKELKPDILIFLDGDYSDYPEEVINLCEKIEHEDYDMVLGSRTLNQEGKEGLSSTNVFGNRLAGFFLNLLFGAKFTDLGPFRAIKMNKLNQLGMCDTNFGWTIEMQIKAIRAKYKITEIPIKYRKRYAGVSKVTGSFKGSIKAFLKITYMFFMYFTKIK
jgi:glycosyltransferase involved in cell wall biosynthesis